MISDALIQLVSTLVVLAAAAERLVEVVKGFIHALNNVHENPIAEARRKAWVQALTVLVCVATAFLTRAQIEQWMGTTHATMDWRLVLAVGVMSAGGSSLWNSVLTYLVSAKDIKKVEAIDKKSTSEQRRSSALDLVPPSVLEPVGSATR